MTTSKRMGIFVKAVTRNAEGLFSYTVSSFFLKGRNCVRFSNFFQGGVRSWTECDIESPVDLGWEAGATYVLNLGAAKLLESNADRIRKSKSAKKPDA